MSPGAARQKRGPSRRKVTVRQCRQKRVGNVVAVARKNNEASDRIALGVVPLHFVLLAICVLQRRYLATLQNRGPECGSVRADRVRLAYDRAGGVGGPRIKLAPDVLQHNETAAGQRSECGSGRESAAPRGHKRPRSRE